MAPSPGPPHVSDSTPEAVEDALERARNLDDEAARAVLERARRDLRACRDDPSVDDERLEALEMRLAQRRREVGERDAYDGGGMGAAMNPEEEDAP